jgi:hypothetical protein
MKKLKILFSFIALMLVVSISHGQLVQDLHRLYVPSYSSQDSDTSNFKPWHRFTPGETKYSMEMGAGYSSFGNNAGFSNSFISPMVSYSVSENLQITVGGRFSNTNFNNMPMFNHSGGLELSQRNGRPTEAFAYGRYIVNNKLSVYGMGAFGKDQVYYSPYNAGFSTSNYQQYSIGMDYKVSEKVSIGASFGFSNGPAYGFSPYGNNRQSSFPYFP